MAARTTETAAPTETTTATAAIEEASGATQKGTAAEAAAS